MPDPKKKSATSAERDLATPLAESKSTPFQDYMKNPGAVQSDTTSRTVIHDSGYTSKQINKSKNPANQNALNAATKSTYGKKNVDGSFRAMDCGNLNKVTGTCSSRYKTGTKQYKTGVQKAYRSNFDGYARRSAAPYTSEKKSAVTAPAKKANLAKSKLAPSGTQKRFNQYAARGWKQDKTTIIKKK